MAFPCLKGLPFRAVFWKVPYFYDATKKRRTHLEGLYLRPYDLLCKAPRVAWGGGFRFNTRHLYSYSKLRHVLNYFFYFKHTEIISLKDAFLRIWLLYWPKTLPKTSNYSSKYFEILSLITNKIPYKKENNEKKEEIKEKGKKKKTKKRTGKKNIKKKDGKRGKGK